MNQDINTRNVSSQEDIEAVNTLVKEIVRAIRENTINCDRTFKTIIKKVTPKGYVILDESGSERTVGCCIPNVSLKTGQMVYVKVMQGAFNSMCICGICNGKIMISDQPDINKIFDYCNKKFANKTDVPTKNSQLVNDSDYVTNITDDLANYYKKSEVYTKNEIDLIMEGINDDEVEVENIDFSNYFEE